MAAEASPLPSAHDTIRSDRIRAVGTAFLRRRPAVALVGAAVNAVLLTTSGAPAAQRAVVGSAMLGLLALFLAEAWLLRSRRVTEAWLVSTLVLTALVIAAACGLSGGARSPFVPLLFAPIGVAFAAFGRGRSASLWLVLAMGLLAGLALLPGSERFPPIAPPQDLFMTAVSAAVAVVLLRIGVAGLTDAHAAAAELLERLRVGTVEESRQRAREAEAVGARVAHELKNPLSAIKGLLQLATRSPEDRRALKRLSVALDEVERMQAALEDYLSFSRPLKDVALRSLDLEALVRDVVHLIEPKAMQQGVRVELASEPGRLLADEGRLKDALLNLVANALAAMPAGGTLRVHLRRNGPRFLLEVADDGRGMSAEELAEAGTPFVSHREGGTGLGLALARGVARQHGGDLSLTSSPGRGTAAMLSLPAGTETA